MEGGTLKLVKKPCRIEFTGLGPCTDDVLQSHITAALASGLPFVERRRFPDYRRLAVVGGGPSVHERVEELRAFDGDIWAINQTASWLEKHGVPCTMFAIDPGEDVVGWTEGVERALLASIVHPQLLANLKGKDVTLFHTEHHVADIQITGGPSAATRVQLLALLFGYAEITWYGCEGSFVKGTHAYRDECRKKELLIGAGGKMFRTTPDYLITTQYLAELLSQFKGVFKEESGGLLRSMIEHMETWSILGYSEDMKRDVDPTSQELFDVALAALS